MNLYLVTGFLGAGKTTFLKNFVNQFKDKKIYLIINEFGKTGIDGKLLSTIDAVLSEINNGSIFCACRFDKFEETLNEAMKQKPDVILVEASGLSDPVTVEKVISQKTFNAINYRGSVCIVDANRLPSVIETAIVCKNQLAVSSLAIVNKTDLVDSEKLEQVKELVKNINPYIEIKQTTFGNFKTEWLALIEPMSKKAKDSFDIDSLATKPDITLQKSTIVFFGSSKDTLTKEQLHKIVTNIASDTYRMKGFISCDTGLLLVDCVGPNIEISNWNESVDNSDLNKLVCLAGRGMPLRKALQDTKKWYPQFIETIE